MQESEHASQAFWEDFSLCYLQVFKAEKKVLQINKQRNDFDVLRFRENVIKVLCTLSGS